MERIAEQHEGTADVETAPGRGSPFTTLTLPASGPEAPPVPETTTPQQ